MTPRLFALFALAALGCQRLTVVVEQPDDGGAPADMAGGDVVSAHGDHHRFAVQAIMLPTSRTDFALDLDGDGKPDNQTGASFPGLADAGFHVQRDFNTTFVKGQVVVLLDLQTADPNLLDDDQVGLTLLRGLPTSTPPDLSGSGVFTVDQDVPASTFYGRLENGIFHSNNPVTTTHPTTATLFLPMVTVADILPVTLHGAQAQFGRVNDQLIGELHGSIAMSDINNLLLPGLAASLSIELAIARQASSQPGIPLSDLGFWISYNFDTGGCTNPDGTMALAEDWMIGECEAAQQPLIVPLRTPDVRIFNDQGDYAPNPVDTKKDAVSYGIGFVAVGASF